MNQEVETDVPSVKLGPRRLLAQLRAERKLSIADVAQRLKYGVRQIEALEAEEFDKLPGATFVRGMVRGYAKLLETDPEPVLGALDQLTFPGRSTSICATRVSPLRARANAVRELISPFRSSLSSSWPACSTSGAQALSPGQDSSRARLPRKRSPKRLR